MATAEGFDLQKIREEQGLTRAQLAEKSGLSAGYIKVIEKKGAKPSVEVCQKLATALGLPVERLVAKYRPAFLSQMAPALKSVSLSRVSDASPKRVKATGPRELVSMDAITTELMRSCYETQKAAEYGLLALFEIHGGNQAAALQALLEFQDKLAEQTAAVSRMLLAVKRSF